MRHERFWWSLPGPAGFLDALESDVQSGRNVVIALPAHHPPGLRDALEERILRRDERRFWRLDLADESPEMCPTPAHLLHARFAPRDELNRRASADTVAESPYLSETVLWLEGLNETTWPQWRAFLNEYKDACRAREEYQRLLFLVPLVGQLTSNEPDVTLAVRRWRSVVKRIDMMLYAMRLVDDEDEHPLYHDLAVAVVTEVAGFDPRMADRMAGEGLAQILDPFTIVSATAKERGWLGPAAKGMSNHTDCGWERGLVDYRNGRPVLHAAAEFAAGQRGSLARRVWRGQIGVLFPFLEENRLRFIRELRRHLRVPDEPMHGTIAELEALELSQIYYQVQKQVAKRRLEPLERCLWIRNELAHLRPIPADVLLAPVFASLVKAHGGDKTDS
jgi:hypothetical protein